MSDRRRLRLTRRGRLFVAVVSLVVLSVGAWAVVTGRIEDPLAALGVGTESPDPSDGTASPNPTPSPSPTPDPTLDVRTVEDGTRLVGTDVAAAAAATADGLLATAPLVVVAAPDVLGAARGVALRLRAPLLPADVADLDGLLDGLGVTTVVTVAAAAAPEPAASRAPSTSTSPTDAPAPTPAVEVPGDRDVVALVADADGVDPTPLADVLVPSVAPHEGAPPLVLLQAADPARPVVEPAAVAAGASVVVVDGPLGADRTAVARLAVLDEGAWALAGTSAAWEQDPELLAWDVDVARSGVQLPGGGLRLFPGRRLVALYGSPGAGSLGVLGEQPVDAAVERARGLADQYAALVDEPVVPTFEIITTVASGAAEPTGDYSRRVPLDVVEPWVRAAGEAGMYVVLDLQPGRTDFLTQAREVEPLLRYPHVGLALDPEWRIGPDQVHLRQIGSVAVEEVQAVADWLADLTRRERLPQKLLLLHQFRLSMIRDRAALRPPPELAVTIQMDGQGSQPAKDETWRAITTLDPPAGVSFGWKNFYDEDTVLRSPADTLAVEPSPVLVSYQ